jgi:quercetin dioxygenase-like cupin family protein
MSQPEAGRMKDALLADEGSALSDRAERTVRALCEHPLLDATWSRYEPGERGPDPHVHHEHVDAFFVVEGELEFGVGPEIEAVRAPAGTFVLVPPDVVHTFANTSAGTVRWLNFHAPSTGFIASMRGDQDGFDSFDAPELGGRDAAEAIVASAPAPPPAGGTGLAVTELGRERRLSVAEVAVAPGRAGEDEQLDEALSAYFVLAGEVEFVLDDAPVRAQPGMWVSVPPGIRHRFGNRGETTARMLRISAPAEQ